MKIKILKDIKKIELLEAEKKELLAALELAMGYILGTAAYETDEKEKTLSVINSAIAKAKGETKSPHGNTQPVL